MSKRLFSKSAVALAAGCAVLGSAHAFVVGPAGGPVINGNNPATVLEANPRGVGHILVVPYYSAQGGNDTYLTITNTDMRNGKAVKVRFRGASNSDDVLDFTVYLSPGDMWSAAITKPEGQDLPVLRSSDKSCTQPAIPADGVAFITARLHPNMTAEQKANETREGYIEILNMADIPPTTGPVGATNDTLYRSIEHVSGVPRDCASSHLDDLLNASVTTDYATASGAPGAGLQLEVPSTGLMANWAIVNVPKAASYGGVAYAVEARTAAGGVPGYGNIVFHPQTDAGLSGLAGSYAIERARTSDPLLRGGNTSNHAAEVVTNGTVVAASYDLPDLSTPYLNADLVALGNGIATKTQAFRLTQALAVQSVANEYTTFAGFNGMTDWTFTMPTRRYNVARSYTAGGTPADERQGSTVYTNLSHRDDGTAVTGTGSEDFFVSGVSSNVLSNTVAGKRHQLCVTGISFAGGAKGAGATEAGAGVANNRISPVTADREERFVASGGAGAVFSPAVPGTPASFCGEASVLAFNAEGQSSALAAEVARREIATEQPEGWVRFATPGVGGLGLPVIGYGFVQLTNNAAAPGTSGNYGLTFSHRTN